MGPRRRNPKGDKGLQRSRWREARQQEKITHHDIGGFSTAGAAESPWRAGVLTFTMGC